MALLISGVLVAMLGAIDDFVIGVVIVSLLGVTLSLCGIGSQILIQTQVDDELRGRVSSFWSMIAFGGTSLGSLLVGVAAHLFGLQPSIIATGVLCFVIALLSATGQKRRH
jgi:sugar phosphate permease